MESRIGPIVVEVNGPYFCENLLRLFVTAQ